MKNTFYYRVLASLCATFLVALTIIDARAQSPVAQGQSGDWFQESASGLTSYGTRANKSFLSIDCDIAQTLDNSWTGISLEINGKLLPPNSSVSFDVDGKTIEIPSEKSGGIGTDKCPECVRKFRELWLLLRTGRTIKVTGSDGNSATFSLKGASRLLPKKPCKTGS